LAGDMGSASGWIVEGGAFIMSWGRVDIEGINMDQMMLCIELVALILVPNEHQGMWLKSRAPSRTWYQENSG
jgi:hypothetical protein